MSISYMWLKNTTDNVLADCWTTAMTNEVSDEVCPEFPRDFRIPLRYFNADHPRTSFCGSPRSKKSLLYTAILAHFKAARLIVCSSPSLPILRQPEYKLPHRLLHRPLKVPQSLQPVST